MITVPTYLLRQWGEDIKRLYPTAKLLAFDEKDLAADRLPPHPLHEASWTGEDDEVTGARLAHKRTAVVRRYHAFRHDVADAEAALISVWIAENATVREHLKALGLSRVDRQRHDSAFLGRQFRMLCMAINGAAPAPLSSS